MPKYSYRLRDETGGLKTGVMEALDHRLAREDLVAKGWRVEELVPADPSEKATPIPTPPAMVDFGEVFAAAEKKKAEPAEPAPAPAAEKPGRTELEAAMQAALAKPSAAPPRAPSARLDPGLQQQRRAAIPPVPSETLGPAPAWRLPVVMTLIVVGLIVWIYQSRAGASPTGTAGGQSQLHDVKVVVKGRLQLSDLQGRPRGARVTLHLPQIPLDVTREGDDLALNDQGDFQIELAFQSSRVPSQVDVSASKDGYQDARLEDVVLHGDPLSAELPPMVLRPSN